MEEKSLLYKIRHSLAHVLAMAVLKHYPHAKLAIGPVTENGFYYDFDFGGKESPKDEDLAMLEDEMRSLIKKNLSFKKKEVSKKEAEEYFKEAPYKVELIKEIIENGEEITLYTSGSFTDLCRGGHVESTDEIAPDGFGLVSIAGAYWRADENNAMLTRIYGIAFKNKEELLEFKAHEEEAKKRDHRKLGRELDLFVFSELVGSGLPLFTPKGTLLRTLLQEKLSTISKKYGMQSVTIPHIAKRELYELSGHADKFGDELLKVVSHYGEFVMKPVNCPHHIQIYASKPRSYKDLPVRYMESTMQYRDEKPGEIGGLTRVRSITVDDGHIFLEPSSVKEEAKRIVQTIDEFYSELGLYGNHWVSLSVRDQNKKDNYVGVDADWEHAEAMLEEVSQELNLNAQRIEGEAAIYGPKLDFIFKDSLGREWQLATIQIDFTLPKRFNILYTDRKGEKKTPVIIHRAILGSYERALAILIEHFAGAFPLWLSPVQVVVLPISEVHKEYAERIGSSLTREGVRVELFNENETLGKRIREAKMGKIPYFLVIGDDELAKNEVTVEHRERGKVGKMSLSLFVEKLTEEGL
ncbi:MAG: threonine--tRNA ligase [Candidatus Paceibacterota bacterium]